MRTRFRRRPTAFISAQTSLSSRVRPETSGMTQSWHGGCKCWRATTITRAFQKTAPRTTPGQDRKAREIATTGESGTERTPFDFCDPMHGHTGRIFRRLASGEITAPASPGWGPVRFVGRLSWRPLSFLSGIVSSALPLVPANQPQNSNEDRDGNKGRDPACECDAHRNLRRA
jgi:hypothetical protein